MELGRIVLVAALSGAIGSAVSRRPDFDARERVRIQAHFDSVLVELRGRNIVWLTPGQRQRRERIVQVLAAYRDAGQFPHNYDRPGLVPTFVDPVTGVRCAVAHLVTSTGNGDIVERLAAANNHLYVIELAADTAFRHWLSDNGLTLSEAARIQVPYAETSSPAERAAPAAMAFGSATLAIANLVVSRGGKHRVLSTLGILGGAVTVVAGSAAGSYDRNPALSNIAVGAGGASAIVGVATMFGHGNARGSAATRSIASPSKAPVTTQLTSMQKNALVGFTGAAAAFGALNAVSPNGHNSLGAVGIASGLASTLVGFGARSTTSRDAGKAAIIVGALSTVVSAVSFSQPHHLRDPFDSFGDTRRVRRILIGTARF